VPGGREFANSSKNWIGIRRRGGEEGEAIVIAAGFGTGKRNIKNLEGKRGRV